MCFFPEQLQYFSFSWGPYPRGLPCWWLKCSTHEKNLQYFGLWKGGSIYILFAFLGRILCLTLASCWQELHFVLSKLTPTLLQLRPGASQKGGVLQAVTIWGCWHSAGHCFLWRQMVIVLSNRAMESLTEQHDSGCWDFQNTVKSGFFVVADAAERYKS